MSRLARFLAELKHRRVYQVAMVYAAAAFVATQAADLFFPRLGLPDWTVTVVAVLAVAGLPVALILGWVFDLTPGGVRRTAHAAEVESGMGPGEAEPSDSPPPPGSWRIGAGAITGSAVLIAAGWWLSSLVAPTPPPGSDRLAVLPLANLMNDPAQDYFVDGMHDALVGEISQVPSLLVISRQSVLQYRGSTRPLPEIARELGVDVLVLGSVYIAGDSVRINVQLVQARPEANLWAGTYRRSLGDALTGQGEVARAIAEAVRASISPELEHRLAAQEAVDPQAQDAFIRAVFHLEQASLGGSARVDNVLAGIENLERAIALEPGWAKAHGRLAVAHHMMGGINAELDAEHFPKSKAAALRAIELDERESWAHAALGFVRVAHERDLSGAERSYRRALELDPNSHDWRYAMFLQTAGRFDEAVDHFRRAQERHPASLPLKRQTVTALHCAGRHQEAIRQIGELKRLGDGSGPGAGDLEHMLGTQYVELGRYAEGIPEIEQAVVLRDSLPQYVARLAWARARAGDEEGARQLLPWLTARDGWIAPELFAVLGHTDQALTLLESAADLYGIYGQFLCWEGYRALSHHPQAREVARRMGLPVS